MRTSSKSVLRHQHVVFTTRPLTSVSAFDFSTSYLDLTIVGKNLEEFSSARVSTYTPVDRATKAPNANRTSTYFLGRGFAMSTIADGDTV